MENMDNIENIEEVETDVPNEQEQTEQEETKEKVFTQSEVNEIVRKRLERESKKKANINFEEMEKTLSQKENTLNCKEYLIENGYTKEYLNMFKGLQFDEFKNKVEELERFISFRSSVKVPKRNQESATKKDMAQSGFNKGYKHIPKKYY